jgi:hypothetical protein
MKKHILTALTLASAIYAQAAQQNFDTFTVDFGTFTADFGTTDIRVRTSP